MEGMDEDTARILAQGGVRTMEELAECATDEVLEIIEMDEQRASELIMTARAPWFEEELP
jgi:N utilization substance protein A